MQFNFFKYHGTGNDFIIIDNRKKEFDPPAGQEKAITSLICHRRYGAGADGLILIEEDASADFRMHYFNSDGKAGSLCGNGSRCAAAFAAHYLTPGKQQFRFMAVDGMHNAIVMDPNHTRPMVSVSLNQVEAPANISPDHFFVHTGSPHLVRFVQNLGSLDVSELGRKIRYAEEWAPEGLNVNFAEKRGKNTLSVRTYERGVEDETLSCGTGVTAAAIAAGFSDKQDNDHTEYNILTSGGELVVSFRMPDDHLPAFSNIRLKGPAQFVFRGVLDMATLKKILTESNELTEQ